jgi:hypothetical protein
MNNWFCAVPVAPQFGGGSMLWGSSEASPT